MKGIALPADLSALMERFEARGAEIALVGGSVRDLLTGTMPHDLDMATDRTPDELQAMIEAMQLRSVPTGLAHGTLTLLLGTEILGLRQIEITSYRADIATDGRHAQVRFSRNRAEDAWRRDFTINALYADARGVIYDPCGDGLADLESGTLRFIGEPKARIAEDYLRILRFFRFTARFSRQGIDAEGLAACAELQEGLDGLSAERIGAEMRAMLALKDPLSGLGPMAQCGILTKLLPGASLRALGPLLQFERAYHLRPDPLRRLAALGLCAHQLQEALRLSRRDLRALQIMRKLGLEEISAGEAGYRYGQSAAMDGLLLRAAALEAPPPADLLRKISRGAAANLPVRAADLPPHIKGKAIGDALAALEAAWIASDFTATRAALLAQLSPSEP